MPRQGKAAVLDKKTFERTLAVVEKSHNALRNVALLYTSFGLGLRAKEMASLRIGDVLGADGKLLYEVNLLRHMTKGEKQRIVYLHSKKVRTALENYLADRVKENAPMYANSPLFLSQKKGKFSPNSLQQLFALFYRNAGVTGASSHSGRRTFATNLDDKGISLKSMQMLMGHASITNTAEYVENNPSKLKNIAENALW